MFPAKTTRMRHAPLAAAAACLLTYADGKTEEMPLPPPRGHNLQWLAVGVEGLRQFPREQRGCVGRVDARSVMLHVEEIVRRHRVRGLRVRSRARLCNHKRRNENPLQQ